MSESAEARRTVASPTTGARVCLMVAVLLILWAVYFMIAPIQVIAANGRQFDCGTAVAGPTSKFATGICGSANSGNSKKALLLGAGAIVVGVGGFLTFGVDRREQSVRRRPARRSDGDDED